MNWYYSHNGQQVGPVSEAEFQNLVNAGTIKADTLVWREGMANWQPYSTVGAAAGSAPPNLAPPLATSPIALVNESGRAQAEQMVKAPAIALIVIAIIGIVWIVGTFVLQQAGVPFMNPNLNDIPPEMRNLVQGAYKFGYVTNVLNILAGAFMIYGALQMKKLSSHGLAVGSAVVAIIPCVSPCCPIGIAVGIWALVVLNKPEVKSQFT